MSDQGDAQPDVTPEWLEGHLATVFSRSHPRVAHLLRATSHAIISAVEIEAGGAVRMPVRVVVASGGRMIYAGDLWASRLSKASSTIRASTS